MLFYDVRKQNPNMPLHRAQGVTYDSVVYADDTICISQSARALNQYLQTIELEGLKYNMRLNVAKCELLMYGRKADVKLSNQQKSRLNTLLNTWVAI